MTPLFRAPRFALRRAGISMIIDARVVILSLVLAALAIGLFLISLSSGRIAYSFAEVLNVLGGGGDRRSQMVILEWRLPRAVAALILGALLGLSGAIFQSVTRNPLGSPDIVGFDAGAYSGALVAMVLLSGGWVTLAVSAMAGGLLTGVLIYLLAWRRGTTGFHLIVIGIGVSAMLTAVNQWVLLALPVQTAMAAGVWASGSLARTQADQAVFALIAGLLLIALTLLFSRRMRLLEMGDARAAALGISVERSKLLLMVLAVAAMAISTSVAGPIPFVALAAPQMARLLTRAAGTTLLGSMATGSALLVGADYIAQHIIAPAQVPVGIVTLAIGGGYFLWLLIREARK
ncbi:ferric enterobactin transport system permease protein FepG (plasmid) [Ketogulonicigenium vulgare Y25]|uniref:Ferric enterobactin transport system permease protein FepG n=1 Tax=Ketogulonicigenium vulgare (strain WSH-001) TaxID=759362 RepID=F9YB29_KETVW|nr:iron chelate uptake ABC transporter family permease subunit [Ketogulonicigenium vulgare]ADO44055.1 ferric enterobactin transport system permease protein FepG [Ketogulonicigenium vulgare Y25]AEM42581.1 Ferric enterobactin transport system permease protein FepG [Ketogulonicigenium vulgare WSH-001]ALJ82611.1 iron ABC transporter permease [Ketogulonicigenium vulgare]AOZ53281.1 ferric enterobactin transport system permease protein FepG [Ketogulonicigenium vulgare]